MHRLAIGENHDAQPASTGFFYSGPTANSASGLLALVLRTRYYSSNPGFTDSCAVAAAANDVEVFRGLHPFETTTPGPRVG
jgi:hypothetical protein